MTSTQIEVKDYSYFVDNFSDVIWINSHSGQPQYPF
jgi:hypothetical protein